MQETEGSLESLKRENFAVEDGITQRMNNVQQCNPDTGERNQKDSAAGSWQIVDSRGLRQGDC